LPGLPVHCGNRIPEKNKAAQSSMTLRRFSFIRWREQANLRPHAIRAQRGYPSRHLSFPDLSQIRQFATVKMLADLFISLKINNLSS
jgi:hypothetical protein